MAGNFFRGTNVDQDCRWGNSDERLMSKIEKAGGFNSILNTKVDLTKVKLDIIKRWCNERITEILGFEDDIVVQLVCNLLDSEVI